MFGRAVLTAVEVVVVNEPRPISGAIAFNKLELEEAGDVAGLFTATTVGAGVITVIAVAAGLLTATAAAAGVFTATAPEARDASEIAQFLVEAREATLAGAGVAKSFAMLLFMTHPREPT